MRSRLAVSGFVLLVGLGLATAPSAASAAPPVRPNGHQFVCYPNKLRAKIAHYRADIARAKREHDSWAVHHYSRLLEQTEYKLQQCVASDHS